MVDWTGAAGPIAELIRQSRFDEALARLYQAREEQPGDPSIRHAIQMVHDAQSDQLLTRLGPIDGVPARTAHPIDGALGADDRYLLAMIDGKRTVDRLLDASTLDRHRTIRSLTWLVERGLVAIGERRHSTAPTAPEPALLEVRSVVVADASSTQAVLTRTLARLVLGHAVRFHTVASGPEAIEMTKRHSPELLILEFMLPGSDGLETLRKVREHPSTVGIGAMLVVQSIERDYVRGRVPGRTVVLTRPLEKAAVGQAIGQLSLRALQRAS